ncbi:unnamed protein product [Polarella glacialis]|uniref:Ubiquitin-like protease family profile domain-containing protein n=1 Tax=Polarella glacialis TaxID=89957 RepID=A0A813KX63_POLGL|nr:unnamed protein product [Polarella glacialis]
MPASGEIVVSWKDAQLTRGDVALFQEGQWLNDQCITFFLEHLGRKHGEAAKRVLMLGAETAFWFVNEDDFEDLADAAGNLELDHKDLILCPINDNTEIEQKGGEGSHWSLLVGMASSPGGPLQFAHYDSMGSTSNLAMAEVLAQRLASLRRASETQATSSKVAVQEASAARQSNSCDCGVYVLMFADVVLQAFLAGHADFPSARDLSAGDTAKAKRQEALAAVEAASAERRVAQKKT